MLRKASSGLLMIASLLFAGCKDDLTCKCMINADDSQLISTNFEVNTVLKEDFQDPMLSMSEKKVNDSVDKYLGPYIFTIGNKCSFIALLEKSIGDTSEYRYNCYNERMEHMNSENARNCVELARALKYINL
jgi:hypothetical protein